MRICLGTQLQSRIPCRNGYDPFGIQKKKLPIIVKYTQKLPADFGIAGSYFSLNASFVLFLLFFVLLLSIL